MHSYIPTLACYRSLSVEVGRSTATRQRWDAAAAGQRRQRLDETYEPSRRQPVVFTSIQCVPCNMCVSGGKASTIISSRMVKQCSSPFPWFTTTDEYKHWSCNTLVISLAMRPESPLSKVFFISFNVRGISTLLHISLVLCVPCIVSSWFLNVD